MSDTTSTFDSEIPASENREPEWALCVALDCEQLGAPAMRVALNGVDSLELGRGTAQSLTRTGTAARLSLTDRWASEVHARLKRDGEVWRIEDAGSKNGSRVNQRRIEQATLADGDVIECAGTFLVLRRAPGPIRDRLPSTSPPEALHTLSPWLERELSLLPRIAQSKLPVLLRGDSGTGKEVMANAVHQKSGRAGKLVPVNCGAIPATLIESELFGSKKGAFSGAEDRPGLVRNAEGGTLFLDEVAELPGPSQGALLRLLQEGEVMPLGSGKPSVVDVRVVAATHQPLEEWVADGRFRRDLFARLRGYELKLLPLVARLEDLGLLISALLARIEPGKPNRTLSRAAARALFSHPWPFHVRELEQTLRAAVAVANGPELSSSDLRLSVVEPHRSESSDPGPGSERDQLLAALKHHGGNLSAVARAMVTSRTQVQRLLDRHGLDANQFKPE